MFGKFGRWLKNKVAVLIALLPIVLAQTNETATVDLSGLTTVMTTLIYAILPLLVIVMVFKVFGNVVKSISDIF